MIRTAAMVLACGLLCFISTTMAQTSGQSGNYLASSYGQVASGSYNPVSNYDWLSPGGAYYVNYYWYPEPYYYGAWRLSYYGGYPYYYYYPTYYYRSYGPWYYDFDPWWAANVYGPYRTTYYWWS